MLISTNLDLRAKGIRALQANEERYRIPAAASIALNLSEGDTITVTSPEGAQSCEAVPFDNDGRPADRLLDRPATLAPSLANWLDTLPEGSSLRRGLLARRADVRAARAVEVLTPDTRSGASAELNVRRDGLVVFSAPETAFQRQAGLPPSDLVLLVRRSATRRNDPARDLLPEPLGAMKSEVRIDAATAQAYMVSAGDYIQVLDVSGRQCSDFVVFDRAALDKGEILGLSDAATRSNSGLGFPKPGLHSKFYDMHNRPVLEVVQDTVGRHDTFLVPCTARYYEELGYPGHTNCTDNFNASLAPYGIQKKAYSALNLFMNAEIDAGNVIVPDTAWSRAGDYVLFRAHRDLVVCTSACPSDIDMVNGWNPTDIHVRVYDKNITAKKLMALPLNRSGDKAMTQETSFHPRTSALSTKYTEYKGFWLPSEYQATGARREYWACREKATICDMSALRKFEIVGPGAERLTNWALTRDVSRMSAGDVAYSAICHSNGAMLDDGTVFRMTDQNFRWICNDDATGDWLRKAAEEKGIDAWVKSSTPQLHNLAVQGPASAAILDQAIWIAPINVAIAALGRFRFTVGRVGGPEGVAVVVSRTGYTGLPGYEVMCHPRDALQVWDAISLAGAAKGLVPMGFAALDILRTEAGFPFAGAEFGGDVDPFEAGIGFAVPSSKTTDYSGKEALERRRASPRRALVGLRFDGDCGAIAGDQVYASGVPAGAITSTVYSPLLQTRIALARLDVDFRNHTDLVQVGKPNRQAELRPAKVVKHCFVPHSS